MGDEKYFRNLRYDEGIQRTKLKQIKSVTKIDITEKKIPTGKKIIEAQVAGVFEKLFTEHENLVEFDNELIPDLSAFTKEELVHQMLQLQLRDMALYYLDKNDLADQKLNADDGRGDRGGRDRGRGDRDSRGGRDRDRGGDRRDGGSRNSREGGFRDGGSRDGGSRDGGSRDFGRDRDGGNRGESRDRKPRKNSEDMVRFFFNLGKRDHLKKIDMLEIINKSTD